MTVPRLCDRAFAPDPSQRCGPGRHRGWARMASREGRRACWIIYRMCSSTLPPADGKTTSEDSLKCSFDATYGVPSNCGLRLLPLVLKYQAQSACGRNHVMDDGTWHSTFQDFRFNLRYNAVRGPLVITPFIGSALPSHKYEYWAHSAAGRRLRELHAGVTAARLLDTITPGLFVQGRYAFAFPQRVRDADVDIRPYRSNTDLEVGYFVTPSLRVLALGAGQITSASTMPPTAETPHFAQRQHHDQHRENFLNLGVGAAFDVSDSVALFGPFLKQAAGRTATRSITQYRSADV